MSNETNVITEAEARQLGDLLRGFSQDVGEYRVQHHATLTRPDAERLKEVEWSLLNSATGMITYAVGVNLATTQLAVEQLGIAIQGARDTLRTLASVENVLDLVTSVTKLAGALASGSAPAILSALSGLKKNF